MSEYNQILVKEENNVLSVILNRPEKRNAISIKMIEELTDVFTQPWPQIRYVVIAGKGDCFAAGADLSEMINLSEHQALTVSDKIHKLLFHIREFKKPVFAAIHGYAIGGGFELAMACDMILATEESYFMLPELKYQLIPGGGGTQRLPRMIGKKNAFYSILTGYKFSATEAFEKGIVQVVMPGEATLDKFLTHIEELTNGIDQQALGILKLAVRRSGSDSGFAFESEGFAKLFHHKAKPFIREFVEGK